MFGGPFFQMAVGATVDQPFGDIVGRGVGQGDFDIERVFGNLDQRHVANPIPNRLRPSLCGPVMTSRSEIPGKRRIRPMGRSSRSTLAATRARRRFGGPAHPRARDRGHQSWPGGRPDADDRGASWLAGWLCESRPYRRRRQPRRLHRAAGRHCHGPRSGLAAGVPVVGISSFRAAAGSTAMSAGAALS